MMCMVMGLVKWRLVMWWPPRYHSTTEQLQWRKMLSTLQSKDDVSGSKAWILLHQHSPNQSSRQEMWQQISSELFDWKIKLKDSLTFGSLIRGWTSKVQEHEVRKLRQSPLPFQTPPSALARPSSPPSPPLPPPPSSDTLKSLGLSVSSYRQDNLEDTSDL